MPYLIDGYNLLCSVQKLEEFSSLTDVQLCRAVSDYLRCVRDHGHIVFDGIGPPDKSAFGGIPSLEVYFSGQSYEADDVIEEKILDNSAPKSLVVVSSDKRLRKATTKRKAKAVPSEFFWQHLLLQLEKQAARPTPEPSEKRHGLTERETDVWLDVFDIEK
ncbi:MAG: NYN domain-containing protein [Planctomycetota bacterium]|jgi:predicted RNA-binding protein with PIN domain